MELLANINKKYAPLHLQINSADHEDDDEDVEFQLPATIQLPPIMPRPESQARRPPELGPPIVAGNFIGLMDHTGYIRKQAVRGSDTQRRRTRRCRICVANNSASNSATCKGRGGNGAASCEYFDANGNAKS